MSDKAHQLQIPSLVSSFEFQMRTRLIFGVNSIEQTGELAKNLPAKKILLVTDAGIVAAGHAERLRRILESKGLIVSVFDRVQENPTTRCVDDCLRVAKENKIDAFIALGGGSSIDTAKGCNFLLTNGGEMKDFLGLGKATRPMLPLIAIPTTAGTGSECQSAALIADEFTHQKMACLDPKAAPRIALLDPALTVSQPERVTACTGIDAIAHALESAVTKKRNAISAMFSREAFRLMAKSFATVLRNPRDIDARGNMLLGAAFAGIAIENSMLGAVHSAANPLTAHFGIIHGQAVGMMLPHIVRFNGEQCDSREIYADLASVAEISDERQTSARWLALVQWIRSVLELAKFPKSLAACGGTREKISELSAEAAQQWTANFNPRPVTSENFESLYEAAFE